MTRLRKRLLPRTCTDVVPVLFVTLLIPITYWFEMYVVLPELFSLTSLPYIFNFVFGHFLLFNIIGNLLGIIVIDTSISGRYMPAVKNVQDVQLSGLGYCEKCETVTPPRSYHCPACDVCILKRDHHCTFSGCCIGHYNYRYYLMFLFHMAVTIVYCLPYNIFFLWPSMSLSNFFNTLKFICPMLILFFGIELNTPQCHMLLFMINICGLAFVTFCLYYHTNLVLVGRVVHEERTGITKYDLGQLNNIKEVLGVRWNWVWLSPFVKSTLPHDGITFAEKYHAN